MLVNLRAYLGRIQRFWEQPFLRNCSAYCSSNGVVDGSTDEANGNVADLQLGHRRRLREYQGDSIEPIPSRVSDRLVNIVGRDTLFDDGV